MKKEQYIYKSTLKSRGWTDKLINKFLPSPDKMVSNPHYMSGPKSSLYLLNKVEELESSPQIKEFLNKNKSKRDKRNEKKEQKKELEYRNLQESIIKVSDIISDRVNNGISNSDTQIIISCGPTNSGKTHFAINDLKNSSSGCYLAPLRLLAWENYYRLNHEGVYCSLLTGENKIIVPGATIYSATVEMFDPEMEYECVILDEVFNLIDRARGSSFSRVLLQCKAKRLHVITAEETLRLITDIFDRLGKTYEIKRYERLVPLTISKTVDNICDPIDGTAYITFSRLELLELKNYFEGLGKKVSVVYGNLPPENRKKQVERFLNGETQLICASDAVGQGINLPTKRIVFLKTCKYDGKEVRQLTKLEVKQIAGRAGRYGLSESGEVSAITKDDLDYIKECLESTPEIYSEAKIAPELNELEIFPDKRLCSKLIKWANINPIPPNLRDLLFKVDLSDQIELASAFSYDQQEILGIENVFKLIKAPVKKEKDFWLNCCRAILKNESLPLPEDVEIFSEFGLVLAEQQVNNCEVYNWISNCTKYKDLCNRLGQVEIIKKSLIEKIDKYLLNVRTSKVNKLIKKQVKLLEQQEDQCWQEYEILDKKKGNK